MAKKIIKQAPSETWEGLPCCVMASGPSLGFDDYEDVEAIRQSGLKVIAVNSTFKAAPFCDVLYAGDNAWWRYNVKNVETKAERWSCSKSASIPFGTKYRRNRFKGGFNSGALAIELAANVYKSPFIILLGFDSSVKYGIHHHGPHKNTSNPTPERAAKWMNQFTSVANDVKSRVINCSRYTELTQFEKMGLREALSLI